MNFLIIIDFDSQKTNHSSLCLADSEPKSAQSADCSNRTERAEKGKAGAAIGAQFSVPTMVNRVKAIFYLVISFNVLQLAISIRLILPQRFLCFL